ncbi:hypothetical protein TNIN_200171 [Trichonephila inaurata madagascariensis]|uniref:Uncharacterized protein n=1 Tax=Trichonephila inaurata madagascariensis TaxID=2747483 RepID=A0A8X6YNR8_9ARAC|nr:hypothetical protein TNIN_200171 [Trichonephila inaurata madagascariensis]
MAGKMNSANNAQKGLETSTSPDRTLKTGMPTPTHMEKLHLSTAGSTSMLNYSTENIMNLSLPASAQSSRPGKPQDFATGSSNCQGLLRLANLLKGYAISIDGCHRGINELIQAGLTDPNNSIMLDNTRVLKDYNQRYQQAVNGIIPITATTRPTAQEINTPIPTHLPSNSNKNECLNLITQILQQTVQALSQLVQRISYINIAVPTPPPTITSKSKSTNISKSKIKKKAILALFNDYLDDEDD